MPGGGVSLLYASRVLDGLKGENDDQTHGIKIVRESLGASVIAIADNAGANGDLVAGRLLDQKSESYGYNAASEEYCDMLEAGVIDPVKVVRTALQDAASVANAIITTEAAIVEDDTAPLPSEPNDLGAL